jgi:spermidine synthase
MLFLFFVPVALFGTVSPYAIRLLSKVIEKSGEVAGRVFAIGTVGSILGTFLASYVFIPFWGVRETILFAAFLIITYSALPLMKQMGKRIGLLIAVPAILLLTTINPLVAKEGLIFETESAYQLIQVYKYNGWRYLIFNEGNAIHSFYHPEVILTGEYYDYVNILPPMFDRGTLSVLYLGLGAGTSARQLAHYYGDSLNLNLIGVEIDPAVTEVGKKYFAMSESGVNVVHDDARHYLKTSETKNDIIVLDTYNNQAAIPNHLATVEYFQDVKNGLTGDGILAANIVADRKLMDAMMGTINKIFKNVYQYKSVVFASDREIDFAGVRPRLTNDLLKIDNDFIKYHRMADAGYDGEIFTDNNSALDIISTIR